MCIRDRLIIRCTSNTTEEQDSSIKNEINVDSLAKEGFKMFQEAPEEAVQIFKQVARTYEKQEDLKQAGITNLNIANVYDEYLAQLDSALVYTEKSLSLWAVQQDTLQMANLYKYLGLLKGRTGSLEEGKSDIDRAIRLYQSVGFNQGIAVSEINLAEVLLEAKQVTKSEALFVNSTSFWKERGDLSRVFTNNILGIQIYDEMGEQEKIEVLIAENEEIMSQRELNVLIKNRFLELLDTIQR